jgi:predicted HTH domain antitoxin
MPVLTIDIPDKFSLKKKETVRFLAAKLFEAGKLSLGQAAEMTGLSKKAFTEILKDYGVRYINYSLDDVLNDVKKL